MAVTANRHSLSRLQFGHEGSSFFSIDGYAILKVVMRELLSHDRHNFTNKPLRFHFDPKAPLSVVINVVDRCDIPVHRLSPYIFDKI